MMTRWIATLFTLICLTAILPAHVAAKSIDMELAEESVVRVLVFLKSGKLKNLMVGHGSGFIVSEDGYIVTNHHVAGDSNMKYVVLPRGMKLRDEAYKEIKLKSGKKETFKLYYDELDEWTAEVVDSSKELDYALLKVKNGLKGWPALSLNTGKIVKGENVYVIGFPGVLDNNTSRGISFEASVSSGSVNKVEVSDKKDGHQMTVYHDANTRGGNSGGPLLNSCGEVIGLHAFGVMDQSTTYSKVNGKIVKGIAVSKSDFNGATHVKEFVHRLQSRGSKPTINTASCVGGGGNMLPTMGGTEDSPMMLWAGLLILVAGGVVLASLFTSGKKRGEKPSAHVSGSSVSCTLTEMGTKGNEFVVTIPPTQLQRADGCSIGREGQVELDVPSEMGVSRMHARIWSDAGILMLEDLNSSNGTKLNGRKIAVKTPVAIHNGDSITLGKVKLVVSVQRT